MLKQKLKENKEIISILVVFIILRLIFFFRFHDTIWDEAVYIGMAKYIFSLGKIGLFEILRPLVLPIILGVFWKIGTNIILVGEIIQLLFSIGCIYLTYKIGQKIINKTTGIIAALLLAFMPLFILNSQRITTGIPSTLFALLALYYFTEKRVNLAGFFIGLAFLTRFPQGLMLIVLGAVLLLKYFQDKKIKKFVDNLLKLIISFFLTILPFLVFNYFRYRTETSKFYHAIFRPMIYGSSIMSGYNWIYDKGHIFYIVEMFKEAFIIIFVLVALYFFFKKRHYKSNKFNTIFISLLIYLIYFSIVLGHKEYRYILISLPYVFLFVGFGIKEAFDWIKKKKKIVKYTLSILLILILALQLGMMIKKDITYIGWRHKEESKMISDYYSFFEKNNIQGLVLTTDPIFAAYNNNKFIDLYHDIDYAQRTFDQNKNNAISVTYAPRSFPCQETDSICLEKREKLFSDIKSNFNLKFKETYYENDYYIYIK